MFPPGWAGCNGCRVHFDYGRLYLCKPKTCVVPLFSGTLKCRHPGPYLGICRRDRFASSFGQTGSPVRFGDFPAVERHAGAAWSSWYFPPGEKQAYKGEGIATQHHLRSNPFWIDWKTGSTDEAAKCRLREILWQKKAYFRRNTLCISRKYNAFMPLNCRKMPKACFFRDS